MDCKRAEELMSLFLLDELDEQQKRELTEHVQTCPVCKETLGDMRVTARLLQEALTAGPVPKLSSETHAKLMAAVGRKSRKEKQPWTLVNPLFRKAAAAFSGPRRVMYRRAAVAAGVLLVCGVVIMVIVESARRCQIGPMITDYDAEGAFTLTEAIEEHRVTAATSIAATESGADASGGIRGLDLRGGSEPRYAVERGEKEQAMSEIRARTGYDKRLLRPTHVDNPAMFGCPSGEDSASIVLRLDAAKKPAQSGPKAPARVAWKGSNAPVNTIMDTDLIAGVPVRGFEAAEKPSIQEGIAERRTDRDPRQYADLGVTTDLEIRGGRARSRRDYGGSGGDGGGGVGGALGPAVDESNEWFARSANGAVAFSTGAHRRARSAWGNRAGGAGTAGEKLRVDGGVRWQDSNYVSNRPIDKISEPSEWKASGDQFLSKDADSVTWGAASGPGVKDDMTTVSDIKTGAATKRDQILAKAQEETARIRGEGAAGASLYYNDGVAVADRGTIVLGGLSSESKKMALRDRLPTLDKELGSRDSEKEKQETPRFSTRKGLTSRDIKEGKWDTWHADTDSYVTQGVSAGEERRKRVVVNEEMGLDRVTGETEAIRELDETGKKKLAAAREHEAIVAAEQKARLQAERNEQALVQLYKDASKEFERGEYDKVVARTNTMLATDPDNIAAKQLLDATHLAMKRKQWDTLYKAKDKAIEDERLILAEKLVLPAHTMTYPAKDVWDQIQRKQPVRVKPGQSVHVKETFDMLFETERARETAKPGAPSDTDAPADQQFVRLTPDEFEKVSGVKPEQKTVHNIFLVTPTDLIATEETKSTMIEDVETSAVFEAPPVNPWVMTDADRFSTFALDVDTASFSVARSYINRGYLPPEASVRMEEFVNAFDYNYPSQTDDVFTVYPEAAPSPFRSGLTLLKVGIRGKVLGRDSRKRAHLVFVVDASGSMAKPDRMPLLKYALTALVEQLGVGDRVSLVIYGSRASLVLEAAPANRKEEIAAAIEAVQCGGSTNLLEGLKLGYEIAQRTFQAGEINRVILCSDGVANIGSTTAEEMLANVGMFRDNGIGLTAAGFGSGAYNDVLMEKLANKGDGNYVFVDSRAEAQRVFVEEMAATLQTIAKDAKIQVEFDPTRVRRYRLIGFENRDIADKDFRNDAIDAGEVGSGQSSTALYEVEMLDSADWVRAPDLGIVYVRYRNVETGEVEEISQRLESAMIRARTIQHAPRFYLAACAATFAEILRGSEHAADTNFDAVRGILEQVVTALPLDARAQELLDMVRKAKGLPRGN